MTNLYVGVDLGGTNIKAGVVDQTGKVLAKDSIPTEGELGRDVVVANIGDAAAKVVAAANRTDPGVPADVRTQLDNVAQTCHKHLEIQAGDNAVLAAKLVAELATDAPAPREATVTKLRDLGREAYPALVEGLGSADLAVRQAAFDLLRSLTQQTFDYKPDLPEQERTAALERWRVWLKTGSTDRPAPK